jgi:carboxymethylenebutenolidase
MSSETIEIETADGTADAYLSKPDDEGRRPGVLLLMDAFGVRPQIEQMAERIASRGYVVLAPNLFYRAGREPVGPMAGMSGPDARARLFQKLKPLMDDLTPERLAADGDAYLARLEAESDGPIAITGYCMGVRVGIRIAAAHPDRVVAIGGFHGGGLVTDEPDSPHRSVGSLRAELYLGFADNDQSMTPENIGELERALEDAGVEYRAEVYAGAAHGYTMADMPVYDEEAAERHYEELFALLERTTRAGHGAAG